MSNYLQNQSTSERLLQTEEGSSITEEERTFYENTNNKYSGVYNVQNKDGEESSGTCGDQRSNKNLRWAFRLLVTMFIVLALYVCLIYIAGPALTNSTVKQTTMTITACNMTTPDAVSIGLECNSTINNVGSIPATMHSVVVNVSTKSSPTVFGYMTLPTVKLNKNAPSYLYIKSRLFVTNVPQFTKACFSVLQGKSAEWQIIGHPDISVDLPIVSPTFSNVKLEKSLMLPPTLLRRVRSSSINILKTTKTSVVGKAAATFFSSSILQLLNLGEMRFHMQTQNGCNIGSVYASNFDVKQGFNSLANLSVKLEPFPFYDPDARAGVSRFIRSYLSAQDQTLKLHGPVANKAPFLNALVEQDIYIPGIKLLSNIQVVELDIVDGTKDAMLANALVQFVSDSPVSAGSLGKLTFEIFSGS